MNFIHSLLDLFFGIFLRPFMKIYHLCEKMDLDPDKKKLIIYDKVWILGHCLVLRTFIYSFFLFYVVTQLKFSIDSWTFPSFVLVSSLWAFNYITRGINEDEWIYKKIHKL